jgi:hypothetical protein
MLQIDNFISNDFNFNKRFFEYSDWNFVNVEKHFLEANVQSCYNMMVMIEIIFRNSRTD